MANPRIADRWRGHATEVVSKHWNEKLKLEAASLDSLEYLDILSLNLSTPMNIWRWADLNSEEVKKATVIIWMQLGVFKTRVKLFSMKKTKSDKCLTCEDDKPETLSHLLLQCQYFNNIREEYLPKLAVLNPDFKEIINDERKIMLSILNPDSALLPNQTRIHKAEAFKISRSFCYDVYRKREKFYEVNPS